MTRVTETAPATSPPASAGVIPDQVGQLERTIRSLVADKQAQMRSLEDRYRELAALTRVLEGRGGDVKARALLRPLIRRFKKARVGGRPSGNEVELIGKSGLFDPAWYLKQYPDVAASGCSPIEHYARYGALLRRNPGPKFDANHYLVFNRDVADAGINPLVHYLMYGKQEGRVAPSCAMASGDAATAVPVVSAPTRGAAAGGAAVDVDVLRAENERLRAAVSAREMDIELNLLQLRGIQDELEVWFRRYVELKRRADSGADGP